MQGVTFELSSGNSDSLLYVGCVRVCGLHRIGFNMAFPWKFGSAKQVSEIKVFYSNVLKEVKWPKTSFRSMLAVYLVFSTASLLLNKLN